MENTFSTVLFNLNNESPSDCVWGIRLHAENTMFEKEKTQKNENPNI